MLNVVAVQVGNYCGMGKEYVDALFDGVARNLNCEYRRFCITDHPDWLPPYIQPIDPEPAVKGWWNKIALFRPDTFPKGQQVLYLDLDTVPTGSLEEIAAYRGKFAALDDFFFKGNLNSGVMSWRAGELDHIWNVWKRCGMPEVDPLGDQGWIWRLQPEYDAWQKMLPWQIVSYKIHCQPEKAITPDARLVCFHGKPRPHEATEDWYLPVKPKQFEPAYA